MKKSTRLSGDQIKEIIKTGLTYHQTDVYIKVKAINQINSLLAIVVPAKIVRNAVWRNKIKRQIRYIIDQQFSKIKPGFGLVVVLKTNNTKLDFLKLKEQIVDLLNKAKILSFN